MEGWPSGLRQQFAKLRRVNSLPHGFESHPFRQKNRSHAVFLLPLGKSDSPYFYCAGFF